MSKHTPGPWRTSGKGIKQDFTCIGLGEDAGANIAVATGGKTSGPFFIESDEEVEANARLIAAAPELIAELCYAHQIIHNARQIMTTEQKLEWSKLNEADGVIADGITRQHERAAVIAAATGETE